MCAGCSAKVSYFFFSLLENHRDGLMSPVGQKSATRVVFTILYWYYLCLTFMMIEHDGIVTWRQQQLLRRTGTCTWRALCAQSDACPAPALWLVAVPTLPRAISSRIVSTITTSSKATVLEYLTALISHAASTERRYQTFYSYVFWKQTWAHTAASFSSKSQLCQYSDSHFVCLFFFYYSNLNFKRV